MSHFSLSALALAKLLPHDMTDTAGVCISGTAVRHSCGVLVSPSAHHRAIATFASCMHTCQALHAVPLQDLDAGLPADV